MTVKDFLSGIELNYRTTIILDWHEKRNDTVCSTVTFNGNRVSVFDGDDMYDEFVKAFGHYKVYKWEVDGDDIRLDVEKDN